GEYLARIWHSWLGSCLGYSRRLSPLSPLWYMRTWCKASFVVTTIVMVGANLVFALVGTRNGPGMYPQRANTRFAPTRRVLQERTSCCPGGWWRGFGAPPLCGRGEPCVRPGWD